MLGVPLLELHPFAAQAPRLVAAAVAATETPSSSQGQAAVPSASSGETQGAAAVESSAAAEGQEAASTTKEAPQPDVAVSAASEAGPGGGDGNEAAAASLAPLPAPEAPSEAKTEEAAGVSTAAGGAAPAAPDATAAGDMTAVAGTAMIPKTKKVRLGMLKTADVVRKYIRPVTQPTSCRYTRKPQGFGFLKVLWVCW